MKKNALVIVMVMTLVLTFMPFDPGVYAVEDAEDANLLEIASQLQDPSNDPFDYTDDDLRVKAEDKSFRSRQDLRDFDEDGDGEGDGKCYITPVKCQYPFGTCWGFAAIGAAESSILGSDELNNGTYSTGNQVGSADGTGSDGLPILDLSEKHLAVFAVKDLNDPGNPQDGEGAQLAAGVTVEDGLNVGGLPLLATSTFAAGLGPNLESRSFDGQPEGILEYHGTKGKKYKTPNGGEDLYYSEDDDWDIDDSLRFKQSFELQESYILPSPAAEDENGRYVYNEAGTQAIKDQINQKRAVEIGFGYSERALTENGNAETLNYDNWAFYNPEISGANHAVLIVGYDDNYPKENFSVKPPENGAWLVKNSWGSEQESFPNAYDRFTDGNWGLFEGQDTAPYKATSEVNTGYFWMSYYEGTLANPEALAFDKVVSSDGYYLDQYDNMPPAEIVGAATGSETSMANVFEAEVSEELEQISFLTTAPGSTVNYKVYLLAEGYRDPQDGILLAEGEETYQYGGFHKEDVSALDDEMPLRFAKGQSYSVVVTEKTSDGAYTVNMPAAVSKEETEDWGGGDIWYEGIINENESFLCIDGEWYDYGDKDVRTELVGEEDKRSFDNFPIKGFCKKTSDIDLSLDLKPVGYLDSICTFPGAEQSETYKCLLSGTSDVEDLDITWSLSEEGQKLADIKVNEKKPYIVELTAKEPGHDFLYVTITGTVDGETKVIAKGIASFTTTDLALDAPVTTDEETFTYTGTALTPEATCESTQAYTPVYGEDYKIEYKNNVKCGKAVMHAVVLKDHISQPEDGYFYIVPAKATVNKAKAGKKKMTVTAKNQKSSGLTGYQYSYRIKGKKKWTTVRSSSNKKTIKKLKKGKKYQVRVRGFVKIDGEYCYGAWSKVKTTAKIK